MNAISLKSANTLTDVGLLSIFSQYYIRTIEWFSALTLCPDLLCQRPEYDEVWWFEALLLNLCQRPKYDEVGRFEARPHQPRLLRPAHAWGTEVTGGRGGR